MTARRGRRLAFDPDRFYDRRRLKRGVIVWRTVALLALIVMAIALNARFGVGGLGDPRVGRLWLDDLIIHDPEREAALRSVADDRRVKALIVRIDSAGGTLAAGEALLEALRRVAAKKPVVAVLGATATSAAYLAALGAGLVDALGGEEDARAWLAEAQGVPLDLRTVDLMRHMADRLEGLLDRSLGERPIPPRLRLDGAISLWQAEPAK